MSQFKQSVRAAMQLILARDLVKLRRPQPAPERIGGGPDDLVPAGIIGEVVNAPFQEGKALVRTRGPYGPTSTLTSVSCSTLAWLTSCPTASAGSDGGCWAGSARAWGWCSRWRSRSSSPWSCRDTSASDPGGGGKR